MLPAMNPNLETFSAEKYARNVENHPYHRLYNHPVLLALLPVLQNKSVLDAGCGTGFFAEYFASQGAHVTVVDITPQMIERTRARVPTATVLLADLAKPLPFEKQFDLVFSSLTLQYLEDWQQVFREFARILHDKGQVLFSVHHPFEEFKMSGQNYFAIEKRERSGSAGKQISYRRSLSSITDTLYQTGFVIERLLEPLPAPEFAETDPEGYQQLSLFPGLLIIAARKRNVF